MGRRHTAPGAPYPRDNEGNPTPKAQRNITDAESRTQKTGDGFVQGYNCQAAVDEGHPIVVAQAVTSPPPDEEHFAPLLEQVITNCGEAPAKTTADAGDFSEENVATAEALGTDPFIAPGRRSGAKRRRRCEGGRQRT